MVNDINKIQGRINKCISNTISLVLDAFYRSRILKSILLFSGQLTQFMEKHITIIYDMIIFAKKVFDHFNRVHVKK